MIKNRIIQKKSIYVLFGAYRLKDYVVSLKRGFFCDIVDSFFLLMQKYIQQKSFPKNVQFH